MTNPEGKPNPELPIGLYGVRRQVKRDAALAGVYFVSTSRSASQAKAASRFACPHPYPKALALGISGSPGNLKAFVGAKPCPSRTVASPQTPEGWPAYRI